MRLPCLAVAACLLPPGPRTLRPPHGTTAAQGAQRMHKHALDKFTRLHSSFPPADGSHEILRGSNNPLARGRSRNNTPSPLPL